MVIFNGLAYWDKICGHTAFIAILYCQETVRNGLD